MCFWGHIVLKIQFKYYTKKVIISTFGPGFLLTALSNLSVILQLNPTIPYFNRFTESSIKTIIVSYLKSLSTICSVGGFWLEFKDRDKLPSKRLVFGN